MTTCVFILFQIHVIIQQKPKQYALFSTQRTADNETLNVVVSRVKETTTMQSTELNK